jgi:two-component system cell cycle sensor histidine kinase/response regulator CckA
MKKDIRLLLVEDNEDDAILIERVVRKSGYNPEISRVCTAQDLTQALKNEAWDAILCDYMMPQFTVSDAMQVIRNSGFDLPFIIVSGAISDETAVEMMKAGAHDYLTKNNLSRLVPALDREVKEAEQRHKRRDAEERLRESEKKHRMLVESITDTVIVLTPDGVISEFYSQTPLANQLSISDHVKQNISFLFPPIIAEKIIQLIHITMDESITTTFEYPLNGRWHSARISPHEDGRRAVMVSRDITELKEAEEAARQSHAIAMLYQDITGHDIRNLLQAIIIASDLLYEDEVDPSKRNLINHVTQAVNDASEIITSVQATATLLTTPLEKTSLDFTLRSCLDSFQEEHRDVKVITGLDVSLAIVNADRYLCHMVMSLLSNAVKHNNIREKKIWTDLLENAEGYEFTIADNGPGIKDSLKKSLLDPERRSGGVGILQCVQIASKYGGTFEILDRVEGDWSQGAKVRVWLPKADA